MVRRAVVLLVLVAALTGCQSDEDKEAAVRAEIFAAMKSVPGVQRSAVETHAGDDGVEVDAEVTVTPAGQVAETVKRVRAVLVEPADVHGVSLRLFVKRGPGEHDGRWYYGTAASGDFDKQADLWGRAIESGDYRRVGVLLQSTTRFQIFTQGWTGDATSRPSAADSYRKLVELTASAGLSVTEVNVIAEPTEQARVESDGTEAVPEPLLVAAEKLGPESWVLRRRTAPHLQVRLYRKLTTRDRDKVIGTLGEAGLLTADLEVYEGTGTSKRLWPTA
ncbi:hypothetical protein [Paractinoplanes atraurantiacus]|uniref:Lipoprotein n=1 Tax=Paractinoplanes atraurantiacus TaxID=1036182 RepID=A0A285K9W9_9ACTN|nr:hypothetical protein [Actinoplanes atraurantiacus]SNY68747.1 hypothetical protein SAMN05421748_1345 [Actinoplanes atraurantiacus]